MGNWKLTTEQEPSALTQDVLRETAHRHASRPVPAPAHPPLHRCRRGLWLLEVTGGTIGFLWPNLTSGFGGEVTLGDFDTVSGLPGRAGRHRSRTGRRPTSRRPAATYAARPVAGLPTGDSPTGDGAGDQRPDAVPAMHAPRLQAQLLHHELLVRVPLPRLAIRPAGYQGRGARPGAPRASIASRRGSTPRAC